MRGYTIKPIHLPPDSWRETRLEDERVVEFWQTFDLQPAEVCIRYWLHLDKLPDEAVITLNGRTVATAQGGRPFAADVTDYVWLEANSLLVHVPPAGWSGRAWLQPVPCEV